MWTKWKVNFVLFGIVHFARLFSISAFDSFTQYRQLMSQTDNQQYEHTWFNEPLSMSTTRAIVERRPITPSDEETSFAWAFLSNFHGVFTDYSFVSKWNLSLFSLYISIYLSAEYLSLNSEFFFLADRSLHYLPSSHWISNLVICCCCCCCIYFFLEYNLTSGGTRYK